MILLKNVIKKYGNNLVLNINNFLFLKGKSYLLVGSNGSGKSTLIKCILGINQINEGIIEVHTNNIGYVPERCYYPEFCSIEKFLKSILLLNNITSNKMIDYYCDLFKIDKKLSLSKLSKGMNQKVLIIQALIHNATLYIFDEPLNGLDQKMQNIFFDIVNNLRKNENTVIITTHYPEFYSNKYDYYLKLENGNIVNESS